MTMTMTTTSCWTSLARFCLGVSPFVSHVSACIRSLRLSQLLLASSDHQHSKGDSMKQKQVGHLPYMSIWHVLLTKKYYLNRQTVFRPLTFKMKHSAIKADKGQLVQQTAPQSTSESYCTSCSPPANLKLGGFLAVSYLSNDI